MKGLGDEKAAAEDKPVAKKAPVATAPKTGEPVTAEVPAKEEAVVEKPAKKFEGKGLAGIVKKLSEEKLEDKAKRITEKLEKNPEKKDKVVEKEKRPAKKTAEKTEKKAEKAEKSSKEDKPAAKKNH